MDEQRLLTLCQGYVLQAGQDCTLEHKGEHDNPFDLLYLPEFIEMPDGSGKGMELCVYFNNVQHAVMQQMEYSLLHIMGYIAHVTRPATQRELRAFLGEVNFQLPIGAFDVDEDGTVFLRYTLPVPHEMDEKAFLRQFAVALTLMSAFGLAFLAPMREVIEGRSTAKGAMELARDALDVVLRNMQEGEQNG